MTKMRNKIITSLIISLGCLAIIGAGCQFTTAQISEATMCTDVDENQKAKGGTVTFSPDTDVIYTSAKMSNAPRDTEVTIKWFGPGNEYIDEITLTVDGTRYFSSNLSAPATGWPEGKYKLEMYIDDQLAETLNFEVTSET